MRPTLILPITIALCMMVIGASPAAADDGSAGMRVYRDPATGAFTSLPPGAGVPATAGARGATTPLVEEPGTSAAGGVTINLGDHFQTAITAGVDADGSVRTNCHKGSPADADK